MNTERRKTLIDHQQRQIDMLTWRCCANCEYFDHQQAWCKRYQAQPPPKVIVVGCEEHLDHIPF